MAKNREREAASETSAAADPVADTAAADQVNAGASSTGAAAADTPPAAPAAKGDPAHVEELMPEVNGVLMDQATNLLLDACERWNIDPRLNTRPRELASWRFYKGDRIDGTLDRVTLVTAGGVKLTLLADGSVDADTEERLRAIFRAFTIDTATKQVVPTALPADQSLPEASVTGQVIATAHRHQGGYLRRRRADA